MSKFAEKHAENYAEILRDARWLPHGYDAANDALQFIQIDRNYLSRSAFLADANPVSGVQPVSIPLTEIAKITADLPIPAAPMHFIFHTAFCRSTLLARALEHPGLSAGLSEPGILAKIGGAPPHVLPIAARLLARPWGDAAWGDAESVFVKPTNHANALIPALMDANADARAILMTNPLPSFLAAIIRKGMMGRRWARQLYLEVMSYAGMDLGMDAREQFAMTDLQAAGLAWFLNQRYFDALARKYGARVKVLDGDAFGREPARVLEAVGGFTSVPIDAPRAAEIAAGPVFTADAKTGEDYAAKSARDAAATASAVVEDEIAKVEEWIGMIAKSAGLAVPVQQTLI